VEGTGSSITVYREGNMIQGKNGGIPAKYPVVELVKYEWAKGQEETLNITAAPHNGTEEILFFVRAGLKNDLTGNYSREPSISENIDQQGLEVYRYLIQVF